MRIIDIVNDLVSPIIDQQGFELVDIEFVKEGQDRFLRVYIDKPDGITLDDCQIVSEYLSDKLDEIDPITESYFLEVSSPGINRPLKKDADFIKYKGELIEVSLFKAINGKKAYMGELVDFHNGHVILKRENDELIEIPREIISKANLFINI
ncbi:MAG: ribosome maturation factor RimP [Bacillota bacterium]